MNVRYGVDEDTHQEWAFEWYMECDTTERGAPSRYGWASWRGVLTPDERRHIDTQRQSLNG